mgnify:CR=1 FL=1
MILSGKEILRHLGKEIIIEPFDPSRINPNFRLPMNCWSMKTTCWT